MDILLPFDSNATIFLPGNYGTLFFWIAGIIITVFVSINLQKRPFQLNRQKLIWFTVLSLLILVLTALFGIVLPETQVSKQGDAPFLRLVLFAAVPFMLASGVMGPLPAAILAGLTGVWLAYLDTHNLFTPLILMIASSIFSWGLYQKNYGAFFRWLRFPIITTLFTIIFTSPLILITTILSRTGDVAGRVAWGADFFPIVMVVFGGMILIGGVICSLVHIFTKGSWIQVKEDKDLQRNLRRAKFTILLASFVVLMTFAFFGFWQVGLFLAGNSNQLTNALSPTAEFEFAWGMTWRALLIFISGAGLAVFFTRLAFNLRPDGVKVPFGERTELFDDDLALQKLKGFLGLKSKFQKGAIEGLKEKQKQNAEIYDKLLELSAQLAKPMPILEAMHMVMVAGLNLGASSVRVILSDTARELIGVTNPAFGIGQFANRIAGFDTKIHALVLYDETRLLRHQDISDNLPGIEKILELDSVSILPIQCEGTRLGVFWAVHTKGVPLYKEELKTYKNLAQMAGRVIVNAKIFQEAQSWKVILGEALKHLSEAILIVDERKKILYANEQSKQLFWFGKESFEGKPVSDLFLPGQLDYFEGSEQDDEPEREIRLVNGKSYYMNLHSYQVNPYQSGHVMIFNEHSARERELSAKSNFVTIVSHELRSPLSLILGYAKILRLTGNLNEQQKTYTGNIIDGLEEMKNLVQKLLDLDRIDADNPLDLKSLNIRDLLGHVIESLDAQAKQKNIKIQTDLKNVQETIEGDIFFLTLALKNYLENAIKFSKMGDEITISVKGEGDQVIFAVEDRGIGIAPLDQKHLFNKFKKLNLRTELFQEGSGLGLAIVKSVVEQHGGQVWLNSQLGRGSTFYFSIPQNETGQKIG